MTLLPRSTSAALLACVALAVPQAAAGDPSVGSYYYFAALDKKCPESNAARTAALEQFKQHFIANVRALLANSPRGEATRAAQKLDGLERNGPAAEDLKEFDDLFRNASARDIADLCRSAATDIAQRIDIEKKVSEAVAAANPASAGSVPYLSREELERSGPPFGFLSIQHFYAILKRCEKVAGNPDVLQAREQAFQRLLDGARTLNGLWRTFFDANGQPKETRFPTARAMVSSPEFLQDVKRYERRVSAVPLEVQLEDCAQFESLVSQALPGK